MPKIIFNKLFKINFNLNDLTVNSIEGLILKRKKLPIWLIVIVGTLFSSSLIFLGLCIYLLCLIETTRNDMLNKIIDEDIALNNYLATKEFSNFIHFMDSEKYTPQLHYNVSTDELLNRLNKYKIFRRHRYCINIHVSKLLRIFYFCRGNLKISK